MKTSGLSRIRSLLAKQSFTVQDAKASGMSPALLGYYVKKGAIRRLSRGVYQSANYQGIPEQFRWEDLIEAVNSVPGGVVCLISALAIYEITDEIPRQYWIGVPHTTSIHRGPNVRMVRFRNMDLGRTVIKMGSAQIPIFDRERTIIDAFRLLSREVAIKALKMALKKKIDLKKLQAYAKALRFDITPYLITATT